MAHFANNSFREKGFFVLLLLFAVSNCQNPYEEKTCGILYAEESFGGQEFTLKDSDQSVNLFEDHRAADSGWNSTGSLRIASNCKMEICNDTYFDGTCKTLEQGGFSGENIPSGEITSVSCHCIKECKCTDIFMKKSSCARAYLNGGCKTCNTLYTDLIGEKSYVANEFLGKIEALRIRKGCTLTVYPDEDFNGEPDVLDSAVVEDYHATFNSYECECIDDEFEPRVRPPRPASFPPLISIPTSMDDVVKMLSKKEFSNHPGLLAAHKSLKNRRSSKNAYILLLGSTGAGKSSAINLLFDNPNVTKVGEAKSTTTDIHEFRIPVPVDELGVENSELRVIDTPGLGDTRGLEQDSKFLATLDDFLAGHEELKNRIPNVVLIFHKFNDNRFNGEGSNFVKMIRGFDSFRDRITDENYSNVIFVLSHFCSETNANKKKPDKRLGQFKQVIEDYSLFPRPTLITVAENKASDHDLQMVNGYYKLPNNEYYPRNLFEKLELVTANGGDVMGLGVFRTAFRDSEDFNVTSSTFQLVGKGSSKVEYYLRILSNAFYGVEKTEISQLLQHVWDESIDSNLRKLFPDSLHYLQKSLNIRNVNTKEDIPKTTTTILELLTAIKQDEATRKLLDKALGIKPPSFQLNTVAGYSYNVFRDTYLPTSPFQLGDLQQSDIGFMIPKVLTCQLKPGSKENFIVFDNMQEYLQSRIHSLGIEGNIANESFTGQIKPGYNIKEISFKPDSCSLSAMREIRLFEFVLNDRLDLTNEFKNIVKSLPSFNESNHESVESWNKFFNDYGTHVVKSVYGGGSIEIQLRSDKAFNQKAAQALFDLIKFAEDMTALVDEEETEDGNSTYKTVVGESVSHTLTFTGGDQAYHTTDLTKMSIEKAAKLLKNWKRSLKFNPSMLTTEMRLIPISQIVKKLGQNYSSEIERATSLLFNSSLKYVPQSIQVQVSQQSPIVREDTSFMTEMLKMQQQSADRINDLMIELKRIELENEKRREENEKGRREWEAEQKRQDQEYKTKQIEAQRQSEAKRLEFQAELEKKRQEREDKRAAEEFAFRREQRAAQEAAARRTEELMKELAKRPRPQEGGFLSKFFSKIGL